MLGMIIVFRSVCEAAPHWDQVGDIDCTAPGIRNKFARLEGAGKDWNADCKATPFTVNGQTFSGDDTNCIGKKIMGEWGTWDVLDGNCALYWCVSRNEPRAQGFGNTCHSITFQCSGEAFRMMAA